MPPRSVPNDARIQSTITRYFRRKYAVAWNSSTRVWSGDVQGLRDYADSIFAEATDTVTLTNTSFEGGQASGEITCHKSLVLEVIEDLLELLDPDFHPLPQRSSGVVIQYGGYWN